MLFKVTFREGGFHDYLLLCFFDAASLTNLFQPDAYFIGTFVLLLLNLAVEYYKVSVWQHNIRRSYECVFHKVCYRCSLYLQEK